MRRQGAQLRKRVLRWGNSYGIRLTGADLEELGLQADMEVDVIVQGRPPDIDWENVGLFRLGPNTSKDVDEILYQGYLEDERRRRPKARK